MRPRLPLLLPLSALLALVACKDKDTGGDDTGTNICLPPQMDLGAAETVFLGPTATDHIGEYVRAGDNNGDGVNDVIVSSTAASVDDGDFVGKVVVAHNPATGTVDMATAAVATITGNAEFDYLGEGLYSDDLSLDGYAEVLVGARGSDDGAEDGGRAYVFYGPLEGDLKGEDAELAITVQEDVYRICYADEMPPEIDFTQSLLGQGIVSGDFDSDNSRDIAVGLPGTDWVFLYAGPFEAGELTVETMYYWDCLENTHNDELSAFVEGDNEGDETGTRLAVADLDADGGDDLLIATPSYYRDGQRLGKVFAAMGPLEWQTGMNLDSGDAGVVGTGMANRPSGVVEGVGDVNDDGFGDFMMGVEYGVEETGSLGGSKEGKALLILGPLSTELTVDMADATIVGVNPGDRVGASVSAAGDVNGDGVIDLLVGAPGVDRAGTDAGAAYLVFGPIEGSMTADEADVRMDGPSAGLGAGAAVSSAGDVSGDGFTDMYVTAPGDPSGYATGATFLMLGCVR